MKKLIMLATVAATAILANAAKVDRVLVRQQWPWSRNVKIEFTMSEVTTPVKVSVKVYDGTTDITTEKFEAALSGDRYVIRGGVHAFTFDPVEAFGAGREAFSDFRAQVVTEDAAANLADVMYRVVDLENGAITDLTRADFMNDKLGKFSEVVETSYSAYGISSLDDIFIWKDVAKRDEYKTSKLVLRRIPAGGKEFTMQAGVTANEHKVSLSSDFFLSVFELTVEQYNRIMGLARSDAKTPMAQGYSHFRGNGTTWPTADRSSGKPTAGSTLGRLAALCKNAALFDYPTEAEWEFACRAGYTGSGIYTGLTGDGNIDKCASSASNGKTIWEAGRSHPNAYGLYEMLGNVGEWCMDYWGDPLGTAAQENPRGSTTAGNRVYRGNNVYAGRANMHVNRRDSNAESAVSMIGCRVWCSAD